MNQKRLISFFMIAAVAGLVACNSGGEDKTTETTSTTTEGTSGTGAGINFVPQAFSIEQLLLNKNNRKMKQV